MRLNLKIAIVTKGLTQRQIAAECGIPENRFSEIVRGWTKPRDHECAAIAATLGRPSDQLFDHEHVNEPASG